VKILIADDDPLQRKLLRVTLESQGHTVDEFEHGRQAIEALEREPVDLVISDILMPNLDGYRFCSEARHTPRLAALPIILYSSSYASPGDEGLALGFGASAFLEKPATAEQIQAAIEDVLRRPAPAPPAERGEDLGLLKQYSARLITKIEEQNTELLARAEQLAASEEKFRQLAENILEVFFLTSADSSQMLYVSPAYETIWGRSPDALYTNPRGWIEAIHPEDRARIQAEDVAAAQSPAAYTREFRIVRPDKSVRHIHARGFPIKNAAGEIYRIAGLAQDMTERNTLQAQLLQSQKMEAIGRLAGGIAHDFNNMLTAINGYSQLAMRKLDAHDPAYAHIEQIRGAGERAATLTRQLLAFSRKQILQPRVVSLNVIAFDLQRLLGRLIGEDVQLVTALGQNLGSVRVDPGQIDQVIMNLAVNARDAMPKGGRLTLETSNVDLDASYAQREDNVNPGRYVMLAVSDTGVGMTPEVKAHLFEPFFTTKGPGAGTGLGLATAHGVVKQSGGFITVYSELGHGTTFKVYLPRVDEAPEPVHKPVDTGPAVKASGTILLAEDDDFVRTLTLSVLRGAGYTVFEASSGAEALLVVERHPQPLHLLITDVVMPGIGGPELAHRALELRPDLRVLYMSGYTGTGVLHEGVIGPDTPFLSKPFMPDQLLAKVRSVISGGAEPTR
jgi:two-component system cell cycle sensor histidine kinase/response regulator CckA